MVGWRELIIVLVIVLLVFGTKRLGNIGSDLGNAIKGFKKSVSSDEPGKEALPPAADNKNSDNDQQPPRA